MTPVNERLQFALDFAQMDLGRLPPDGWAELTQDFSHFLFGSDHEITPFLKGQRQYGVFAVPDVYSFLRALTPDEFRALQQKVFQLFDRYAAICEDPQGVWGRRMSLMAKIAAVALSGSKEDIGDLYDSPELREHVQMHGNSPTVQIALQLWPAPGRFGKGHHLLVGGSLPDIFIFITTFLLYESPGTTILRCPDCKTLFQRHGRQKYCSRECVNRATVREFRAKKKARSHRGKTPSKS